MPWLRTCFIVLLLHGMCATATGAPGPAPDVTRGDSYDGRRHGPGWRDDLLIVPRLVLAIPRLLLRGVFWPLGALWRWMEREHLPERVQAALTSDDGLVGVRPAFNMVSGFRATVGLTYFNQRVLGPGTDLRATAAGNFGEIFLGNLRLRPTHYDRAIEYEVELNYNRRDDFLYTGIGMDQARAFPAARYGGDVLDVRNEVRFLPYNHLRLGLDGAFGLRRFNLTSNPVGLDLPIQRVYCARVLERRCGFDSVDERLVPGFNEGTQFVRAGASLRVDTRDHPHRPSSGAMLEVSGDYSHGLGRDPSSYFRAFGQLVGALDLWDRSRVLVFRISAGAVFPTGVEPVPFTELLVLGGPDAFRGARIGRYRDHSMLLATVEYRWPIWMWMDALLFVDYGGVFGKNFNDFDISKMVPAVGAGLRLRTASRFFIRFQVAHGWGEGWHFSFSGSTDPL